MLLPGGSIVPICQPLVGWPRLVIGLPQRPSVAGLQPLSPGQFLVFPIAGPLLCRYYGTALSLRTGLLVVLRSTVQCMPRRLQLEGECMKPCCPCCPVGTVKAAKKVLRFVDVAEGSRRSMLLRAQGG